MDRGLGDSPESVDDVLVTGVRLPGDPLADAGRHTPLGLYHVPGIEGAGLQVAIPSDPARQVVGADEQVVLMGEGLPGGCPQVVGVSFGRRVGFGVLLYSLFCCLGHLVFSRWCFVAAGCSGVRGDKWLGAGEVGDVVVVGASEDAVAAAFANGMKVPEFFVPLRTEQRGVAGASGASVAVAARGRRGFLCLPV